MNLATGQDLYDELQRAARAAGTSLNKFAAPLFAEGQVPWKLEQLRIAKCPMPHTLARVRALIAGEPLPEARPSPIKGKTIRARYERPSGASESRLSSEAIAFRRNLTDLARTHRLPGETLHAAIRRLQHQQSTIADLGEGVNGQQTA
jgi:hypothetical protein